MDSGTKDKVGSSREDADRLSYQTHSIPSEWRFSGDLSESSFNMVATDPSIPVFKGVPVESSSCPSVSMVDSFASSIWDNHNLALRQIDFDSNQNTNAFAQSGADILSQSFAQFPADSRFIERAARFSCFSGGSFSDMVNPFAISGSVSLHSKGSGGGIAQACPLQQSCSSQNDEMGVSGVSKSGLVLGNQLMDQEDSTKKIEHKLANLLKYSGSGNGEDTKKRILSSGNGSENQEISGCVGDDPPHLEDLSIEHPVKPHLPKKKRKNTQGAEVNEVHSSSPAATDTANDSAEHKEKIEPNQTTSAVKPYGKQPKDNSSSDAPKEDYIHVRARRGQATNSHSLAERVRREKISERMKFLQDLVPGCNKVTGKAVMLDEIINYVQSLQQQVEFLSMKLATVTPSLDLSIESLLPKDILQSQAGPSAVHSLHDVNMMNPQLHTHHASIPTSATGIVDPSVSLRRAINSHLTCINGYREIPSEIPGAWGDDLHNVVQMSFSVNVPFEHHELSGSLPPGSMKTEL